MSEDYLAWKDWREAQFGQCTPADTRYFDWHVQRAFGAPKAALRVLELGFGNGSFLAWARQRGHSVVGVETSAPLVARAQAAGFAAHGSVDDVGADTHFDLVAAFDVLEHVPADHTLALLKRLAQHLAPGGRMVLRFPNAESPFGQWYQHGDITHVNALGLSRLRQLAPASGLQVLHWGERLPWRQLPASQWPTAACYHLARRLFERALRKMYRLDRGMDFSPNQLVVLGAATSQAAP